MTPDKIGYAQVLLSHAELVDSINLGTLLCLVFERAEESLDLERVSIGVSPNLAATWFRFQGAMR